MVCARCIRGWESLCFVEGQWEGRSTANNWQEEMAQQLREFVLAEDLGLVPRTHMVVHNQPEPQFQRL